MKSSILLRNIINITYGLAMFSWMLIVAILIFAIFSNSNTALKIFDDFNELQVSSKPALITLLTCTVISITVWVYILSLVKKLIDSLTSEKLFTTLQIASFKLIGQLIILLSIIDSVANFIFEAIFKNHLEIKFAFFDFWFAITVGLFFIFLSAIFRQAKTLKEENDLTV